MDPPIEDLLDKVDSKFTLVALGRRGPARSTPTTTARRGPRRVVPPQVTSVSGKPLSIAFEEIAAGKATYTRRPGAEAEEAAARAAARRAAVATAPRRVERRSTSDPDAG